MSLILETLGKPIKTFPKDLVQELYFYTLPARVLTKMGNKVEVLLFNNRKTTTEVPEDQTRPFAMANISSKNSELRRAYEQAQKLI